MRFLPHAKPSQRLGSVQLEAALWIVNIATVFFATRYLFDMNSRAIFSRQLRRRATGRGNDRARVDHCLWRGQARGRVLHAGLSAHLRTAGHDRAAVQLLWAARASQGGLAEAVGAAGNNRQFPPTVRRDPSRAQAERDCGRHHVQWRVLLVSATQVYRRRGASSPHATTRDSSRSRSRAAAVLSFRSRKLARAP